MPPANLETIPSLPSLPVAGNSNPTAGDRYMRPEPILLPIGREVRWHKLNRALERGESTIGSANPKSSRCASKPKTPCKILHPIKANLQIIGLPGRVHPSGFLAGGSRPAIRNAPNGAGEKKPAVPEPASPKLSCFGSIFSKKERKLCRGGLKVEQGCLARLYVILSYAGEYPAISGDLEGESGCSSSPTCGEEEEEVKTPAALDAVAPELQGMKRYTSSRRPDSWLDGVDLASSMEPLDRESAVRLTREV